MSSVPAVLACALSLLGRSADSMPPIALVNGVPAGGSERLEAFVRPPERTIYIVTSADVYREADTGGRCGSQAHKKLASILAHEEWHVLHGTDERGAYEAQLKTLIRLDVRPDGPVYIGVIRAMLTTLAAREQRNGLIATRR